MKIKSISIIAIITIVLSITPFLSNAQYLYGGYQNGAHGSGGDEILVGINEQTENLTETVKTYPNPFRSFTNIELELSESKIVNVEVFDINNCLVSQVLSNENLTKGKHVLSWEGTNIKGQKLTTGVYYYKIVIGDRTISRKIILMK